MIKTIVVDDEWYNLEEISYLIENTGLMSIEKKYGNPLKALEEAICISPDVAFIDIEMPGIDGLTLAEKLLEIKPEIMIVFVTGWNQYAVQAFDLNAMDYIMKPINIQRFNKIVEKIENQLSLKKTEYSKKLKIKCFGKLEAYMGITQIIWQYTKTEELFAFLLLNHGIYVDKDLIIEFICPGYDRSKALPILQTSICKIRNLFSDFRKEVNLDCCGSKYGLFLKNVECDYIEVEKAIMGYRNDEQKTYEAVKRACTLYESGLLTNRDYAWSLEKGEQIRICLIKILKEILVMYMHENLDKDRLQVLKLLAELTLNEK